MVKTSNIFKCPHCDYSSSRKYNLTLHLNRKNPCKPKENESTIVECKPSVNRQRDSVNHSVNLDPNSVSLDVNLTKTNANIHQCPTCKKVFSCRQAKYKHLKNVKCEPLSQPAQESDDKTENECLKEEIDKLKLALSQKEGSHVVNNYITNNNNSTHTTNNIVNYNNFDSPNFDHITKEMIGEMYLKADRELPRMIGNAVRKIYKGLPENDTIRFKYGNQAGFAEVRQDNETRILPVSDVLETVLSQTSTLCSKELMKCCGPHMIPGPNVVNHAQELSVLHWGFVPETHAKRQGYFKFVKSALL